MPGRPPRRLFVGGLAYAIVVRGLTAFVTWGLQPPGLGYIPWLERSDAIGWTFQLLEMGVDLLLPSLAIYAAIIGGRRRSPHLEMALGLVFLADNVVYIGTLIPFAVVSVLWCAVFIGLQAPLILVSLFIVGRSRAALWATHDSPDTPLPIAAQSDML